MYQFNPLSTFQFIDFELFVLYSPVTPAATETPGNGAL